jgi:transcriptional regulator with XRE-family HTH domain
MERTISLARNEAEQKEREEVASEVRGFIEASGLSRAEFASQIGTSPPRLSTYTTGKVVPSATLMRRMARVAGEAAPGTGSQGLLDAQ